MMTSNDRLRARLRTTLQAKADDVVPLVGDFDLLRPTHLDPSSSDHIKVAQPHRQPHKVLLSVAAVVATTAAAMVGFMAAGSQRSPAVVHTATSPSMWSSGRRAVAGTPLLMPSWVPDGFQLWSIDSIDRPSAAKAPATSWMQLTYVNSTRVDARGDPLRLLDTTSVNSDFSPVDNQGQPVGTSLRYDAGYNELTAIGPHGLVVQVASPNWTMSRADLARVTASVALVDAAHEAALRIAADSTVAAHLPVMASAVLTSRTRGSVTVEVRGTRGSANVVCLVVRGTRSCGTRYLLSTPESPVDASLLVDGTWMVAAAAPANDLATGAAQTPYVFDGGPHGDSLETQLPGAVHAHAGNWNVVLVEPRSAVGSYSVSLGEHVVGGGSRPSN